MTKAYSYVRMSRAEQIRGDSLRRQTERSRKYVEAHGLELDNSLVLKDIGVSAYKGKNRSRGALSAFIRAIELGQVPQGSFLLVEHLDRLSREQVPVALQLFLQILNAGISIVTLMDETVYSNESVREDYTQLIVSIVMMAKAHKESADKAERVAEAKAAKLKEVRDGSSRKLTARAPAWLKLRSDRCSFEVIPRCEVTIKRIFQEAIDGIGAMSTARRLNDDKIKPFGKSSAWHISSVRKILRNEATFGRFQPHSTGSGSRAPVGAPIENYYPAVIDETSFWRARNAIDNRKSNGSGRKGHRFTSMVSKLAYCRACGSSMSVINKGSSPKGGVYLNCSSARRHAGCNNGHLFRMDQFEMGLLAVVASTNLSHPFSKLNDEREKLEDKIQGIDGKIASTNKQIDRYLSLFDTEETDDGDDAVSRKLRELRGELKHMKAEAKRLRRKQNTLNVAAENSGTVLERLDNYRAHVASLSDDGEVFRERARIAQHLRRLIKRIDFWGNGATIEFHAEDEAGVITFEVAEVPADIPVLSIDRARSARRKMQR